MRPRLQASAVSLFGVSEAIDRLLHRFPITAWFRGQTRCFSYPRALVACHSDIPSLAQFQANREGTLFGPGLIIFREGLCIASGN